MAEQVYEVTAMIDNDHSHWRTLRVKAKNEEAARKKADRNLGKIATTWEIDHIEAVQ